MPNIVHRIGIEGAAAERVYQAVATREGVASWWTENVNGESAVGSVLQFIFGKGGPAFQVLELTPPARVRWKCVAGPAEWIDTRIHFDISSQDGETVLLFKHCGWREEVEFMHHCSTQWACFLIGLKQLLESGKGRPYGPRFEPISRWSR
ncbi:MAG: SRPBCC family protein [Gallionella sp.]